MSEFININGRLQAAARPAIGTGSRAFRYGYGLFETMLMRDGRIRLEALHRERLQDGMAKLGIAAGPLFMKGLEDAIGDTARRNGHEPCGRIRVQVWPASGGYYDGEDFRAEYCVETFPLDEAVFRLNENGLVVGIAEGIIKAADEFSHLKSCNAMSYALAARQAKARRWNDALMLNQFGRVADSTIANLFWISDGKIFTPPLSEGCVAGVMRGHLLEALPGWGYEVAARPAEPAALRNADVIFLTNAIRGIRWVRALNEASYTRGICSELHQKLLSSF